MGFGALDHAWDPGSWGSLVTQALSEALRVLPPGAPPTQRRFQDLFTVEIARSSKNRGGLPRGGA